MTVQSMTGFARLDRSVEGLRLQWEVKSVNHKGLDVRVRLPAALDGVDLTVKKRVANRLARGAITAILTVQQGGAAIVPDEAALGPMARQMTDLAQRLGLTPPTLMDLMMLSGRGEAPGRPDAEAHAALQTAALDLLEAGLDALVAHRCEEGAALNAILTGHLAQMQDLLDQARACEGARPQAIKSRIGAALDDLIGRRSDLDSGRLEQEAALLAIKADVSEELDRLQTHVTAAQALLAEDWPVGRQLDFLAQECNREANTLCAKSADKSLTAIGLQMKALIDQLREQCQNVQ
ncbi:MAG: YicC/YloC family endoribonuclease [Rhodothalassiaceae bacterium]